jgi:alkanesulfonate monooxygenase SsuD/methylene tetrahydromethanopterin reductase-like flavin-dependent oxidoreductase (luciferase family)
VRFGIFDHMEARGDPLHQLYAERLELLEAADEAGFWCYHKAEHHFVPLDCAPSANVFLAAAAQRTKRIRLGALVYLLPFHHPLRLIEEIVALDHLSGGRLQVGVGKGISPAEHDLWGLDRDTAREHFEEAYAVLRAGLDPGCEAIDFAGEFYRFKAAPIIVHPLQSPHPPLWYPGNVEYAGRHGLNTIVGGPVPVLKAAIARYGELRENMRTENDHNAGLGEPVIGFTRHVYVAETDAQAQTRAKRAYAVYHDNLATLFKRHNVQFAPPGDPSFGGNADRAREAGALLVGSPQTVGEEIASLDASVDSDYMIAAFAWGDLRHEESMRSLHLFAEQML